MDNKNIVGVFLAESGIEEPSYGRVRADNDLITSSTSLLAPHGNVVGAEKLNFKDEELGEVTVFMTRVHIDREIRRTLISTVVRIFIIDLVLTILTIFLLNAQFIRDCSEDAGFWYGPRRTCIV